MYKEDFENRYDVTSCGNERVKTVQHFVLLARLFMFSPEFVINNNDIVLYK